MNKHTGKLLDLIFFILILIWCIGFLWNFVILYFPKLTIVLPFLRYNYSLVCHQQPEKLLNIAGKNTLVCSRCAGIYFGTLFSSAIILVSSIKKFSSKLFILSSLPMLVDVLLYSLGFYTYSKTIAFATGFLLGSVGFIYIHDALKNIFVKNLRGKN